MSGVRTYLDSLYAQPVKDQQERASTRSSQWSILDWRIAAAAGAVGVFTLWSVIPPSCQNVMIETGKSVAGKVGPALPEEVPQQPSE
jgi:hypothetical protein